MADEESTPMNSSLHLKTYTAGEDGSRLAAAARELGLEQARQPRRQVRRRASMHQDVLHLLLDTGFEDIRMRAVYSAHEEGDVVDPHMEGVGGNLTAAVLGIIKGMVGPAILYLPHGFATAGFGVAIPIMMLTTIMFLYSSSCLLEAWRIESGEGATPAATERTNLLDSNRTQRQRRFLSYPELAYRALGKSGETLVKTGIALMQSGVCLTYLIFVPQNLHISLLVIFGVDVSLTTCLGLMVLIQIPLSWIRDIRKLTPTNLLANCLILYGLSVCIMFSVYISTTSGPYTRPSWNLWDHITHLKPFADGWFLFIGTSVLLFEGSITLLVPLQEAVSNEEQRAAFPKVYVRVILGIICFYTFFGVTCWMAFGNQVRTVLTTSLPAGVLATTVQLAYSIAVVFTFPLQNFPALEISTRVILSKLYGNYNTTTMESSSLTKRNIISSVLVAALAILAVCTMDSLDKVVSLMGSLLGCPIAFVFPPLIHSQLDKNITMERLWLNRFVALLGVGAMVIASITTLLTWS